MEHDGFKCHGLLGRTPDILTVVAEDEVFHERRKGFWKIGDLPCFIFNHLYSQDDVAKESALIRIVKGTTVREFVDLTQVMKDGPCQ